MESVKKDKDVTDAEYIRKIAKQCIKDNELIFKALSKI